MVLDYIYAFPTPSNLNLLTDRLQYNIGCQVEKNQSIKIIQFVSKVIILAFLHIARFSAVFLKYFRKDALLSHFLSFIVITFMPKFI